MRSITWFYLSLVLAGSVYCDVSWASLGQQHYARGYGNHASHRHFSGNHRAGFGTGYRGGGHNSGRRHASSRHRTSFYGGISFGGGYASFGRGYPAYGSYYRRPYYRGGYFSSGFYQPAWPVPVYPYPYPPVIIVPATPPVYIQQPVIIQPSPPAVVTRSNYWHYCEQPAGYYPQVESCPGGWIQVPPRDSE
ncbi:MAG: hypothetical protein RQ714_08525 [Nitrosomonas sp.]|nr:hypothetical protein [Nitrosomonas sp.]